MKTILKTLGSLLAICLLAVSARAAAFTTGNVVVSQYGDGVATLTSAAAPVAVLEYLPSTANQSSPVQTITIPATGGSRLTGSGSAGSEDFITRSTNGTILTFGGYDTDSGTLNVAAGTTAAAVNRVVGQLDSSGNYTRTATGSTTMYSSGNIRSVVSDGINYWMAGSVGGTWYSAGGATPTQITSGSGNFRVARIFNGNLYYSASTTVNAYSGIPTTTASGTATGITGSSVYDFAISPAGNVAYVADDSTLATVGGIAKWTFNGSTWSKKFTFSTVNGLTAGCRGLAVDFSGPNPVLYAATADSLTKLIKITDTSAFADTSDTADQVTVLATATSNYAFKGVALVPTTSPVIISQPSDTNVLAGATISLAVNAATGGLPLTYQWYYPNLNTKLVDGSSGFGGTISGSTSATLTLTSLATAQTGGYQVIITNTSGSVTSRVAQVTVSAAPVPPTIDANITPTGSTNDAGDGVTFSVTAHGVPAVAYQWKYIPDTNNLVTNIIAGATSSSLPLANLTVNQSGKYFVTITNSTSYFITNSAQAVLKVNPPPFVNIATLRGMVDGSFLPTNTTALFTAQGIVTTWADMTGVANTEFYMQDASGGIAVFWSGANGDTNLPPAGALVQVTGPLSSFNGLLELAPVFGNSLQGVTIISTNNPLPKPQPLVFDPNVTGYPATAKTATMHAMESMYFVASNVMLNLSTPNFVSGANDIITNNVQTVGAVTNSVLTVNFTNGAGQAYILFVNAQSGLPGQAKSTGPVTIYGVLGYFTSAGFELTPSRFADVISYFHATNVVTNVKHYGDLLTNSFTESALRPGETLTTYVSASDPAGGAVTLTPITSGLPASASWSNVTSGQTATAIFHFNPVAGDAGVNYVIALAESSTSGYTSTNYWNVYIPTADEQQMAIAEFLANPTSNTNFPQFNPLHRPTDTIGMSTNDEYIEIVNLSTGTTLDYGWDIDQGNPNVKYFDSNAGAGTQVPPSSALVVFGGNITEAPSLPVPKATTGPLVLANAGATLVLRNPSGYIIDRVVYSASDLSTNSSLSRFPTIDSPFVPQAYISTNFTTAGLQYDGRAWTLPAQTPKGVNNIVISAINQQMVLQFTAVTGQASTLWSANNLLDPFKVIFGQPFSTSAGVFSVTNLPSMQFYYITTQTNGP